MSGVVESVRYTVGVIAALSRRPGLVTTALRQAGAMAPDRWWARRPWLPVPPDDYLAFRTVTATGSAEGPPSVEDTIVWLEWCRTMRSLRSR